MLLEGETQKERLTERNGPQDSSNVCKHYRRDEKQKVNDFSQTVERCLYYVLQGLEVTARSKRP